MAFFDDMKGRITQVSQSTAQKAKDVTETARLNNEISGLEKQINVLYGQIGYEVYKAYGNNPMPEIAGLAAQVRELAGRIDADRAAIRAINDSASAAAASRNAASGGMICPGCGARIASGSRFCMECGARIPEQPPIQQAAAQKICPKCGAGIADGDMFCINCGSKVG